MRRIHRFPIDEATQIALAKRQTDADRKQMEGSLDVDKEWRNARRTEHLDKALATLKAMMGERQRCMYCLDSHGTDIEHFWPKKPYPARMFQWPNLLLCCAECGRFKGDRFPLANGEPLLIDPSAEDPWRYLDFDPATGNIVARFEVELNDWSSKGEATVELLQLDRREALAAGYRRTFRRLAALIEGYLTTNRADAAHLPQELLENDDHGLLGWCLTGPGADIPPFALLRDQHPAIWQACRESLNATQTENLTP